MTEGNSGQRHEVWPIAGANGLSAYPLLIEVYKIANRADVFPVGHAAFLLQSSQGRGGEIVPAELCHESIPDYEIAFIETTALLETPLQYLLVASASEDALTQVGVVHAQKIQAGTVGSRGLAHIAVIFRAQFAARVQPNLVQHPSEISIYSGLLEVVGLLLRDPPTMSPGLLG
jgi:hypothetical protein